MSLTLAKAAGHVFGATVGRMPSFNHLTLPTRRLLLRPLREADALFLLAMFSDAKFMQFCTGSKFDSIEQVLAFIERESKAMASGLRIRLGIERKVDKALIGHCDLFERNEADKKAEIGYALSSSEWGRGYMTEALTALLDHSFTQLELGQICAVVSADNKASTKILTRLRFTLDGSQHDGSTDSAMMSDSCLYGLTRSKWLMKCDM
jgi:RimJ/RimL family protein N-acetyltransferase